MIDPVTISTAAGVGLLIVYELIKIIKKGHYKSSCMIADQSDSSSSSSDEQKK